MRTTSHRNEHTRKVEVFIIEDGPDGGTQEVRVDSEWNTSQQANDRIRELYALSDEDLRGAYDKAGALNQGSDPNTLPVGGQPTRARDTRDTQRTDVSLPARETAGSAGSPAGTATDINKTK